MTQQHTQHIYCLDVLKAFAIIAVVLFHSGFMDSGYLGVDVFFVISGYFATISLSKRIWGTHSLKEETQVYFQFELNRVSRLLPLILLASTLCMVVGYFFWADDSYESLTQSVIASNLFANNILECLVGGDYWRGGAQFDPLMHTWYVGVLMQFYLIYPLLFFIAKADKKTPRRTFSILLISLFVVSLCVFIGESDSARKFYLLPARFFELAAGGIIALVPSYDSSILKLRKASVYSLYAVLIVLLSVPLPVLPANVKLLLVVIITSVLVHSSDVLENKVTGNQVVAKIGLASYSIYIWHQVILAFYKSMISSRYTAVGFLGCLLVIIFVSFLSYRFIEKPVMTWLSAPRKRAAFYASYGALFVVLNIVTMLIYLHAGVVRDIPELDVNFNTPKRGKNIAYTSRGNNYNKSFETQKPHWLVIGNSFGLDFINVILESDVADSVELSFFRKESYKEIQKEDRFRDADRVFIAFKDITEEKVKDIEIRCLAGGQSLENVYIVGEKYYGENINLIYSRHYRKDYFQTKVLLPEYLIEKNIRFREKYGDRYLDLISLVCQDNNKIPAFTEDRMFVSWDCLHLTPAGAKYFGSKIQWEKYLFSSAHSPGNVVR